MLKKCKHGLFVLLEKMLRWAISPRLRARLLALLGAQIGRNVRIYEIQLFNLKDGFRNLVVADDVHIGPGCRLDLEARLAIGARTTLSPGVTVLTHQDPGSAHGIGLLEIYPPFTRATSIESDCWVGVNAIILAGVTMHHMSVIAAGSVVTADVLSNTLVAGAPARTKKSLGSSSTT